MKMKAWFAGLMAVTMMVGASSGGGEKAASKQTDAQLEAQLNGGGDRYNSADVAGEAAKIDLEEVQKAFWATQGNDMNTWMAAFEKRVNEIYEGKETVAIAGNRQDGNLVVAGFIDKNGEPGFQTGDERLFTIQQTGAVANNQVPYSVSNGNGQPYYQGSYGFSGSSFLIGMMAGQLLSNWGGYSTPRSRYADLARYRTSYRNTPNFQAQKAANQSFQTRFKRNAAGNVTSGRSMTGGTATQSGGSNRSWGSSGSGSNATSGTNGSSGTSSWGGRRSTGSSGWGAGSSSGSSWGGRRSSSGGRRSFGGRRR